MAYNDNEVGFTTGRPIEIYKFVGTYKTYNLTSYAQDVVSGGVMYEAVPISRNQLKVGTQEQGGENALEITLPFDHPLILEYAYENAPPNLVLTIERAHEENLNDKVVLWTGRVTGFTVEGRTAKMQVPATFSYVLSGNTPTPRYQAPCNHILYDSRCGVSPTAHQHITTISSFSGNVLQVASMGFADNEGAAGIAILPSGEARMIISNIGTAVTISYNFSTIKEGDQITLRKGCDHSFEGHCKTRFANGTRFGGFPLVPANNPFLSSL